VKESRITADSIFRHVFILESRKWWPVKQYDPARDLVLTYDFGLHEEVKGLGGAVFFVDQICGQTEMQKNNFLATEFLKSWHYDENGKDIFTDQGIPFGFAFRIEMWSEYLFYVRLRANLEKLKLAKVEQIYLGETKGYVSEVLRDVGVSCVPLNAGSSEVSHAYFFDIHRYMREALHGKDFRSLARNVFMIVFANVSYYYDCLFSLKKSKKTIFSQVYHPTKKLISRLRTSSDLKVITSSLSGGKGLKKYFVQRLIPIKGKRGQFDSEANLLLKKFRCNRVSSLILVSGVDITDGVFSVIEYQIKPHVSEALLMLSSVTRYIEKMPIHLEVMIANVGLFQTIVDCVLKKNNIPSYLIINGLLSGDFCDEGKYASYINCYSESIKENYFVGMDNVVCLGDPRMDDYFAQSKTEGIQREVPTICIGTSGFNNINLNSYLAVEFDFMFDVLSAFLELKDAGKLFKIIIKVRPNGVFEQYLHFSKEYFPGLEIEIIREVAMREVLNKTDLYISIYSQTLFEASCLGIPVIYYKKDNEILSPPFDQKSELVTVDTVPELKRAFLDFQNSHDRFEPFLEKSVMEKYVGPLDGKNLERNLSFVSDLLELNANEVSSNS
jgi:hypothetical protein